MGLFDGILGGIVGMEMATVVNGMIERHGGIQGVINQFQTNGLGPTVNSWVAPGANQPITPAQVHQGLGPETVEALAAKLGIPPDQLGLETLEVLPQSIDHLTPDGVVPTGPGPRGAPPGGLGPPQDGIASAAGRNPMLQYRRSPDHSPCDDSRWGAEMDRGFALIVGFTVYKIASVACGAARLLAGLQALRRGPVEPAATSRPSSRRPPWSSRAPRPAPSSPCSARVLSIVSVWRGYDFQMPDGSRSRRDAEVHPRRQTETPVRTMMRSGLKTSLTAPGGPDRRGGLRRLGGRGQCELCVGQDGLRERQVRRRRAVAARLSNR